LPGGILEEHGPIPIRRKYGALSEEGDEAKAVALGLRLLTGSLPICDTEMWYRAPN
jgi:hypothetical protein